MVALNALWYKHHLYQGSLPSPSPNAIADFVMAANGVFLRAQRPGLSICLPVMQPCFEAPVPGLQPLKAKIELANGKIPRQYLETVLAQSRLALPNEIAFYLGTDYQLSIPAQNQSLTSCQPVPSRAYQSALVEIHSHGAASAFFSADDDVDETLFRIYAVVGKLARPSPEILVRLGFHGRFWLIPAALVFEFPQNITDVYPGSELP